jgi:hypothetical protein
MRLFITYDHDNVANIRQLVDILSAGGHSAWFDQQLLPGQDWKQELERSIATCEAYVYALTRTSVGSEWCQWEFATAVRLRKAIIPVLLEKEVVLPVALERLQYADLTDGATPIAVAKLMGAFVAMQQVPVADAPTAPADPQGIPSRAWESVAHWTDVFVPTAHRPTNDAEEILGKFAANLLRGVEGVGGRLIVTNQRLLFEAHKLNLQRAPLAIPLDQIRDVAETRTMGLIPNGVSVTCRTGEKYRFVAWNRAKIVATIKQSLARSGQPG